LQIPAHAQRIGSGSCWIGCNSRSEMVIKEGRRLRFDKVDKTGVVNPRHKGRLHHIGIGNAYRDWRVAMLVDGLKIEIVASTAPRCDASS